MRTHPSERMGRPSNPVDTRRPGRPGWAVALVPAPVRWAPAMALAGLLAWTASTARSGETEAAAGQPPPPGQTAPPAAPPVPSAGGTLTLRLEKGGKLLVNSEPYSGEGLDILERIRDHPDLKVAIEAGDGVPDDDTQRVRRLVDEARRQRDPRQRELWEQIAQRADPELRREALGKLRQMLAGERGANRDEAMRTLQKVKDVPFDRAPLLPLVRQIIEDPRQTAFARSIAAVQLANLGGDQDDIPVIAAMADEPDAFIRKGVATALYGLDPRGEHPLTAPAIEKLLNDESAAPQGVVHHTIKALWGNPVSPAAERRLIELSRQLGQSGEIGYDVVYYALSTRPVVSEPVAERLSELALSTARPDLAGRALWGLSHHPTADAARELAVTTLIRILDDSLDIGRRRDCIFGLGLHGGKTAVSKLEAVAAQDENAGLREQAKAALARTPGGAR